MPRRVLVLSPHPDDDAIGCGGTLLALTAAGDRVAVVYLTSGEHGVRGVEPGAALAVREAEARAAGKLLGVARQEFWRQPDGALRASPVLVRRLRALLRRFRPHRVYAPGPAESHADHRATARLARAAVQAPTELLFYEVWTPLSRIDEVVDVTAQIERKLAAVRAHASQCRMLRFHDACRVLARWRGEMFCWPKPTRGSGRYAEVFGRSRS